MLINNASNLRIGDNPTYTLSDFVAMYPQFSTPSAGSPIITDAILNSFISLANASIQYNRWHEMWNIAMGWFVAHFATIYLQGIASPTSGAGKIIAVAQAKGFIKAKVVGDVSLEIDYNDIGKDLEGWASWTTTIYGQQLATMGKLIGKGGSYIY
jgi:hypothetical protein